MSFNLPPGARVAVIGAGVSGLVATKQLTQAGFRVTLFERRKYIGGLWNFSRQPEGRFASGVYSDLTTNFPRQLMEFQDHPHPEDRPLFMCHELVLRYLKDYSRTISGDGLRLKLDTEIVGLYYGRTGVNTGVWHLTSKDVSTGLELQGDYEGVVVAVGMFDKPNTPEYEGIEQWRAHWPGTISHAKTYRGPRRFKNKKVLIVGYQASGFDIAQKIAASAKQVWVSSSRDVSQQLPQGVVAMPEISKLDPRNRQVHFRDGQKLWRVDHILFCTGYTYSQPFIRAGHGAPPMFPAGPTINNLYEHLVYKNNPSLAFVGMCQGGAPTFLVVQSQAAFLAQLWGGRFTIGQCARFRAESAALDDDNPGHVITYPRFMDYILRLEQHIREAADQGSEQSEINVPFKWTLEMDWIRQNRRPIREAFSAFQEAESESTGSLAALGFSVEQLTPGSPRIREVIPFILLHAAYFPRRELSQLEGLCILPLLNQTTEYPEPGFFHQLEDVLQTTEDGLRPQSRSLFRKGALRVLKYALSMISRAAWRDRDSDDEMDES